MERFAIHYVNSQKMQQVCYVQTESMIASTLQHLHYIDVLKVTKETLSCVKEDILDEKYKTCIKKDKYYTPSGYALTFITWALTLYEPNLYTIDKLKYTLFTNDTKDSYSNLLKLALTDLYRKNLTIKDLNYLHSNIKLLPEWLQPYK